MKRSDFKKLLDELSKDLQKSVSDAKNELKKARATADSNLRSIGKKDLKADKKLQEFELKIKTVKANIVLSQKTLIELGKIKKNAQRSKALLRKDVNRVTAIKGQTIALNKEVTKLRDKTKKYNIEVASIAKEVRESKKNIENSEKESSNIVSRMEKIYRLASDSGLAGSFDERGKEVKKSVDKWNYIFLGSIALLVLPVVALIINGNDLRLDELSAVRFLYSTPILGLVIYSSVQYSKERNLLEKYAFKAAMALALESYTELLYKRFREEKKDKYIEQILNFMLKAMESIYKEPHQEPKKYSYKLGLNHEHGNFGAEVIEELEQIVDSADKIKNTMGDGSGGKEGKA